MEKVTYREFTTKVDEMLFGKLYHKMINDTNFTFTWESMVEYSDIMRELYQYICEVSAEIFEK